MRREPRIGRRNRIVAMKHHRGADADRHPLHGGDQRPLGARERVKEADHRTAEAVAAHRGLEKILQIVAGRKRIGHARDRAAGAAGSSAET